MVSNRMFRALAVGLGEFASGCVAYYGSAALHHSYTNGVYAAGPAALLTLLVPLVFLVLFLAWQRVDQGATRLIKAKLLIGPVLFLPVLFEVPDFRSGITNAVEDWLVSWPILLLAVHITPMGWALDLAILFTIFAEEVSEALGIKKWLRSADPSSRNEVGYK